MSSPVRWRSLLLVAGVVFAGCDCGKPPVGGTGGGSAGAGGSGANAGGGDGGSSGTGGAGGSGDGGVITDPNDPNNATKDSDCDGLSDAEEFGTVYSGGQRTNPGVADTDGDGVPDGVEVGRTSSVDLSCMFVGDRDPSTRTHPIVADSDGDGLSDGLEDSDKNGRLDANETNPVSFDTDGDTLSDGAEDANKNGVVDTGETDPRRRDTDGDGINDGLELNITHTNPLLADTDGDTCPDGAEDLNQNGVVDSGETNPKLATDCGPTVDPDTDMDGLPDRLEDKDNDGVVDPGETDENNPDTDGDGIRDGVEDKNRNGAVDPGETSPLRVDSDCDGLRDGPDTATVKGEDQDADGSVDPGESDPARPDSDGDGILDGVERGITAAQRADTTICMNVPFDLDPTTTTNPNRSDTDGDGIDDGAEDLNHNGRVDPGELNPNDATSTTLPDGGTAPAGHVCTAMGLKPVVFRAESAPDLRLGLPATFTELATLTLAGTSRGIIGFDPTNKVGFVAYRVNAPGADVVADEAAVRTDLAMAGALSNFTTQNFTTWDGLPALQGLYQQAGTVDIKAQTNALANALVGTGAGTLPGAGGATGPFQLQVEYVRRATFTVVVAAVTPQAGFTGFPRFVMSDTAGGSGLAQFPDTSATLCETFTPGGGKVDFLFSVDDSASMASYQQALADVASNVAAKLDNSTLDWRIALVTSTFQAAGDGGNNNRSVIRGFTRNIHQFRAWLTQTSTCVAGVCTNVCDGGNCVAPACDSNGPADLLNGYRGGCWIGAGNGNDHLTQEAVLGAARKGLDRLTPGPAGGVEVVNRVRSDAEVVVILLGDADDLTRDYDRTGTPYENVDVLRYFFQGDGGTLMLNRNKLGRNIPVHGIVCPNGQTCGETQVTPRRIPVVITATGGVRGAINDTNSIATTIDTIIQGTIAAAGHQLGRPPIGASVKVALSGTVGTCNLADVPRSTADGFDFSGVNRTVSFFGNCRPSSPSIAAVSYRYWIDNSPNPGGSPPPCQNDPYFDPMDPDFCRGRLQCDTMNNVCTCPAGCGGTPPPGYTCVTNPAVCDFVCTADCGGSCTGFQQCNATSCTCECVQSATCPVGQVFRNGAGVCGCVCDTDALNCGPTSQPDPAACACVCKPGCGGCGVGLVCNPSTCSCGVGSPG